MSESREERDARREARLTLRRERMSAPRQILCKCGSTWTRPPENTMQGSCMAPRGRKCPNCWNVYRRDLRKRHSRGEMSGRTCSKCGVNIDDTHGSRRLCDEHTWIGEWAGRHARIQAELEARQLAKQQELENPTKEETWLQIARIRLSQARSKLRDAHRSQTEASAPERTSRR